MKVTVLDTALRHIDWSRAELGRAEISVTQEVRFGG